MISLSAQGILFCTGECLKAPQDLLKIYLHESCRVYRDKMVEKQDFQVFDKLQTDTVKKFHEVRVFTKFNGGRQERKAAVCGEGAEVWEIIRLPALCLDLDISGQYSEENEEERKRNVGVERKNRGPGEGWTEY